MKESGNGKSVKKTKKGGGVKPKKVKELYDLLRAGENREFELLLAKLIQNGFDINGIFKSEIVFRGVKISFESTLLEHAVDWKNHDAAALLLETGAVISRDPKKQPLLHRAIKTNHHSTVKVLLDKGEDKDLADSFDRTSVYIAVDAGSMPILRLLLEQGAKPDVQDKLSGYTPLMLASIKSKEMCELLINKGANVNSQDNARGYNPLYLAAKQGRTDIVELFLDNGADINIQTRKGKTALHAAVANKRREVCRLLIKRGADRTLQNHMGYDPLILAKLSGDNHLVQFLEEVITGKPTPRKKKAKLKKL